MTDAAESDSAIGVLWADLVTTALLGTDRRDPPALPAGVLADVVDDTALPSASQRMAVAVASVAAVRRAAFMPSAAVDRLVAPDADNRPVASAAAARTLRRVVSEWPVLEDEWVLTVVERGWRLPPDALVELLVRYRSDGVRRTRVVLVAGPVATWLCGHVPELAAHSTGTISAEAVASLPELAVSPELAELLGVDAHTFVRRLMPEFDRGAFGSPHRAVLVNLVARCRPEVLRPAADALPAVNPMSPSAGLAFALADLATLRAVMLDELDIDGLSVPTPGTGG